MHKPILAALFLGLIATAAPAQDNTPPTGFEALFNGKDLAGWQGLVPLNQRAKMSKEEYAAAVEKLSIAVSSLHKRSARRLSRASWSENDAVA